MPSNIHAVDRQLKHLPNDHCAYFRCDIDENSTIRPSEDPEINCPCSATLHLPDCSNTRSMLGIPHLYIATRLVRIGARECLLISGTTLSQPLTISKDGDWREIYAQVAR